MPTPPAPNNRSVSLTAQEERELRARLVSVETPAAVTELAGEVILGDMREVVPQLKGSCVDLLFLDPPYNITKAFGDIHFTAMRRDDYANWMEAWLMPLLPLLKPTASIYICGDWRSSSAIEAVAERYFKIRSRITWEREKGRGAKANWKNTSEDIWFCTIGESYTFNPDAVRLRRSVRAPYRVSGEPKDWSVTAGGGVRDTSASNLWTDLVVPFWSMPENTEHPTQKPEKLLAKIMLASTSRGDFVLDPFLGSGTTSVVARKLGRSCVGIEIDARYAAIARKRLDGACEGDSIQGLVDGVFWERNSSPRYTDPAPENQARLLA